MARHQDRARLWRQSSRRWLCLAGSRAMFAKPLGASEIHRVQRDLAATHRGWRVDRCSPLWSIRLVADGGRGCQAC